VSSLQFYKTIVSWYLISSDIKLFNFSSAKLLKFRDLSSNDGLFP